MKNIMTSEFTPEIENQIVQILKTTESIIEKTKKIMRLGFDLFESRYYASQEKIAGNNTFKLTHAQLNMNTFQAIFPKF